jgi:hypothetical protein
MHRSNRLPIPVEEGDDRAFTHAVEKIANSTLQQNGLKGIIVVKIDNWFGSRWLNFSGKLLGALGVRKGRLTVPPFVPARVVWQRRFSVERSGMEPGKPLHLDVPSEQALNRYLDVLEPGSLVLWFSGESVESGRGSVMVYVPTPNEYITWYASFTIGEELKVVELIGISLQELIGLLQPELSPGVPSHA